MLIRLVWLGFRLCNFVDRTPYSQRKTHHETTRNAVELTPNGCTETPESGP